MKTLVQIDIISAPKNERVIIRNLSRIMDIRILDIDMKTGKIWVSYASPLSLNMVYRELERIGCRLQQNVNFLRPRLGFPYAERSRPTYS